MELTADLVHGFTSSLLMKNFDNPVKTPEFHHKLWDIMCLSSPKVAVSAPRGHAKSTAVTHAYALANILFRCRDHVLIVSDTEGQASGFLGDIKTELTENEELRQIFKFDKLVKDTATECVGKFDDGKLFRIIVKGSEQKMRGLKWRNKRPNLIICHEEGTRIYADSEWMFNQDHPTATIVNTSGYEITFEDGTVERVSNDHRYWIEGLGWTRANELEIGNTTVSGENEIESGRISKLKYGLIRTGRKLKRLKRTALLNVSTIGWIRQLK